MAKEDVDLIDKALDAAEITLNDKAADEFAAKPDLIEEVKMKEQIDSASKERDETGKFSKKAAPRDEIIDQEADVDPSSEAPTEESEEPLIDAPTFWSAERKLAFAKAPRDVQQAIVEHEAQRNDYVNRIANEVQPLKQVATKLYEGWDSYKDECTLQGVPDPIAERDRYRAWNAVFKKDPKVGISQLMQKHGLTPADFYGDQGQTQPQYQTDPRVDEALADAKAARELAESYQKRVSDHESQVFNSKVQTFRQGKDSRGQTRAEFAAAFAPQIAEATEIVLAHEPHRTFEDALNVAYEHIIERYGKLYGSNGNGLGKPPAPANANKAKAAAGSVTGAPASGVKAQRPRLKGETFNDKVDSALDNVFERAGL